MNQIDLLNANQSGENLSKFLDQAIKDFVNNSSLNIMLPFNNLPMFVEPVVAFADGENPAFKNIKTAVAAYHLTPREVLETARRRPSTAGTVSSRKSPPDIPGAPPTKFDQSSFDNISVICGALPINPVIMQIEGRTPYGSPILKFTSWIGGHNGLPKTISVYLENLLSVLGYIAIAPSFAPWADSDWSRVGETCRTTQSNWSERHVAEICGLGTFGLHGQIITSKGSAVYLFSLVTNASIAPTPRSDLQNCLYYRDGSCMACIGRCPGGAISEKGRTPTKCHLTARANVEKTVESQRQLGAYEPMIGGRSCCGLCFSNVPCSSTIPD